MKTKTIIVSSFLLAGVFAVAAPPQVTGVTAAQQEGTKLVNVSYNLALDGNQTAFVELWFSHNNGLTYPIHCSSLEGAHGAGVVAGSKTTVWDAGADWDGQFTSSGKIRVIATYGDEPSGYDGGGGGGGGSGQADASLLTVAWDIFWSPGAPGEWSDYSTYFSAHFASKGGDLNNIKVDPMEVTNEKWNEVAEWGMANGYTQLPLASAEADPNLPMTGINLWQALKWCNARSEKDGLEPAYYIDVSELIGDHNDDGQIINGTDTFSAYVPDKDLNMNGKWDEGEIFTDNNSNEVYDGIEFHDTNGNNQYDAGRSQVFRQGANIPDYGKRLETPSLHFSYSDNCIDWSANGYRLTTWDVFFKLTTGGNHKKDWPWGDTVPTSYPEFTQHVRARIGGGQLEGPVPADAVQANGYGLKHLIGNVAEWGENAYESNDITKSTVFGGSYLGLDKADETQPTSLFTFSQPPNKLFNLMLEGSADATSPAIGLRCVRYSD